jgi:dienelactone hydrolase
MASHGYASLALAYFGYEDLPGELLEIPLESIESAIVWLDGQEAVDAERLAVIGGSKGGELALLAAATYPQIKAVVGCVASGIVWQGVHEYEVASSWSLDGQGLPYAKWFFSQEDAERFMAGESVALRNAYAIEMNDPETLDAATIPVEKINGPVLLVSGTDDQMWPSDVFGDLVMERLAANDHPHERRHLKVDGGGHLVFLPVFVTGGNRQPVPFMFGGTAEADANGSVEFWGLMLDFLNRHLGAAG